MKQTKTCPKCGSTEIIQGARIFQSHTRFPDSEHRTISFDRNPSARFFKRPHRQKIQAWICSDCGYIENYAAELTRLNKAYKMRKTNSDRR